jgi:hypothetical protein
MHGPAHDSKVRSDLALPVYDMSGSVTSNNSYGLQPLYSIAFQFKLNGSTAKTFTAWSNKGMLGRIQL